MQKEIRLKLKKILVEKNINSSDLAKMLGISTAAMSKIMNSEYSRPETIKKIAEALNIPISYFLGDDNSVQQNVIGDNAYNVSQNLGSDKSALEKDIEIIKLKLDLILEKIDKKG